MRNFFAITFILGSCSILKFSMLQKTEQLLSKAMVFNYKTLETPGILRMRKATMKQIGTITMLARTNLRKGPIPQGAATR